MIDGELSVPFLTRKMLTFESGVAFSLRVTSQSGDSAPITIRGMTREGVFTLTHNTVNTGVVTVEIFRLPDIPILISVMDTGQTFTQGGCYMTVQLVANDDILQELAAGFVYSQKGISWPTTNQKDQMPNNGRLRVFAGSDPAAGAEIAEFVPAGRIWNVKAVAFTLVTAAVAASRRVHLQFSPGGVMTLDFYSDVDQIISETKHYTCAATPSVPDRTDGNDIQISIPENLWLFPGDFIGTVTTNLNAGDNFGIPRFLVEEFWTPSF